MPILADCHVHSHHSGDSDAPMEDILEAALAAGLDTICFTEHNDFAYPAAPDLPAGCFELNVDSYLYELLSWKERYVGRICVLFGIELGMQPETMREDAILAKSHEFDFILASTHLVGAEDPYYPEFFEKRFAAGRTEEDCYREYFEAILTNLKKHSNYDVCGHLDYLARVAPSGEAGYDWTRYSDLVDGILQELIGKGKGLELNTGSARFGMQQFHPCAGILRRYRELGGEIVTVGSDTHRADGIGLDFARAAEVLKDCGFRYYAVYEKRVPEFRKI